METLALASLASSWQLWQTAAPCSASGVLRLAPGLCSRSSLPSSADAELYRRFHYFPCNSLADTAIDFGCSVVVLWRIIYRKLIQYQRKRRNKSN